VLTGRAPSNLFFCTRDNLPLLPFLASFDAGWWPSWLLCAERGDGPGAIPLWDAPVTDHRGYVFVQQLRQIYFEFSGLRCGAVPFATVICRMVCVAWRWVLALRGVLPRLKGACFSSFGPLARELTTMFFLFRFPGEGHQGRCFAFAFSVSPGRGGCAASFALERGRLFVSLIGRFRHRFRVPFGTRNALSFCGRSLRSPL